MRGARSVKTEYGPTRCCMRWLFFVLICTRRRWIALTRFLNALIIAGVDARRRSFGQWCWRLSVWYRKMMSAGFVRSVRAASSKIRYEISFWYSICGDAKPSDGDKSVYEREELNKYSVPFSRPSEQNWSCTLVTYSNCTSNLGHVIGAVNSIAWSLIFSETAASRLQ